MKSIKSKVAVLLVATTALLTGGVIASAPALASGESDAGCTEPYYGNVAYGLFSYAGESGTYRGYVTQYGWDVYTANVSYYNIDIKDGSTIIKSFSGLKSQTGSWTPPSHIHNLSNATMKFGWRFTNGTTYSCTVHG